MKVDDVLAGLNSIEPLKATVAIATLNALSACCWDQGFVDNYRIRVDADVLDAVRMPTDSSITVIGAFVPVLVKLMGRSNKWWVIEQDPKTQKDDEMSHFIPADRSEETIAATDVLIITGVTLVNQTLEDILKTARTAAEIAVIWPTASVLPDALFCAWRSSSGRRLGQKTGRIA